MESERIKKIYLNVSFALSSKILITILNFVSRKIFINTLGVEYLGYNSVFSNLLQLLNLADLGVGSAITSYLYKPLATGNKVEIASLMRLYKGIYRILGISIIFVGVILSIFVPYIITDAQCSPNYLRLLFGINLLATVSSYFWAYKSTLLVANQKNYLLVAYDFVFNLFSTVLRILFLIFLPNYILYLIIGIASTLINNIVLSLYVDKKYKYLSEIDKETIKSYKKKVTIFVKDIFISKIGGYIYSSTDNIIISLFRGSILTGYLSNYTMITNMLYSLVRGVFASIQATYGNYINSTEDIQLQRKMTDNYLCMNYYIGNFCMICFFFLVQPFITLFFAQEYVMDIMIPFWLSVNLLLTIILSLPTQVFVVYRLYHYDRWIVAISAVGNIVISVALVRKIGVEGVLIGTFITSLFYLFSRFYIISRMVYKISYLHYIKKFLYYFLITVLCFFLEWVITRYINCKTILIFIIQTFLVVIVAFAFPLIFLRKTSEFNFLVKKLLPTKLKKIKN